VQLHMHAKTSPNWVAVVTQDNGEIWVISINRPEVRNCVDGQTAAELAETFIAFDKDATSRVAVLYGKRGFFCAGADLRAVSNQPNVTQIKVDPVDVSEVPKNEDHNTTGVMGFSRLLLSKPVIAAVQGHAVAGGLELACWCDLRVVEENAIFGVFCRRWGVPLIDGGTFRLAHLIGMSRAMDMVLTGRPISAKEAYEFGLANRVVPPGTAVENSIALAREIAHFPQDCMRADRMSVYNAFYHRNFREALHSELGRGVLIVEEAAKGAKKFAEEKQGRHGSFEKPSQKAKL